MADSKMLWMIEHRALGAYLGEGPSVSSGRTVPLFRKDHPRKPMASFRSLKAAKLEVERLADGKARRVHAEALSIAPLPD